MYKFYESIEECHSPYILFRGMFLYIMHQFCEQYKPVTTHVCIVIYICGYVCIYTYAYIYACIYVYTCMYVYKCLA